MGSGFRGLKFIICHIWLLIADQVDPIKDVLQQIMIALIVFLMFFDGRAMIETVRSP